MQALYTIQEIADLLGVSPKFVRDRLSTTRRSAGYIWAYKIRGGYRITLDQPFFEKSGVLRCLERAGML